MRDCAQLVHTLIHRCFLQVRPLSQSTTDWSVRFFLSFRDSVLTLSVCSSSVKIIYRPDLVNTCLFISSTGSFLPALKMCTWGLSSWKGDIARQVWIFRLMAACVLSQMATDLWQDWFMHCVCEVRIGQPSGVSEVSSCTLLQFSDTVCSIYLVHYQTSRISSAAVYSNTSQ